MENVHSISEFLHWLEDIYNISQVEGWYEISKDTIENLNKNFILQRCGGILPLLKKCYGDSLALYRVQF
jgi:hypothetical protein